MGCKGQRNRVITSNKLNSDYEPQFRISGTKTFNVDKEGWAWYREPDVKYVHNMYRFVPIAK